MTKTTTQHSVKKAITLLIALTFAFTGSAFADQWLHVKVEGGGDEQVTVNLPVSLIQAAAALIPAEVQADINSDVNIAIDDFEMDWNQLLDFWDEVKRAPEATFITVESGDETVNVRKEGDFVIIRTTEHTTEGAQVNVTFPLSVVDGLLSGPEGTLNFQAALDALAAHGPGNLVTVRDGDETVRIWIDNQNEAE